MMGKLKLNLKKNGTTVVIGGEKMSVPNDVLPYGRYGEWNKPARKDGRKWTRRNRRQPFRFGRQGLSQGSKKFGGKKEQVTDDF